MAEKNLPLNDSLKYPNSKLTFLGTGTSQGIPMIGCNCKVCKSSDHKDQRLRSSVFIEHLGFKLLIDCGPDFRQQMLRENITELDAVLLTHQHKDHTGGLDDIRAFNYFRQKRFESQAANAGNASAENANLENRSLNSFAQEVAFPIYAESIVQEGLKKEYHYAFEENKYPGVPDYKLITISDKPFEITKAAENSDSIILKPENKIAQSGNKIAQSGKTTLQPENHIKKLEVIPIRVMHYKLPILGFRFGNLAYITDGSSIPESEFEKLKGLEVLVINTVRHTKHISHFSLPEALEIIRRVGAPRNYLTHLSHQLGTHEELTEILEKEFPNQPISTTEITEITEITETPRATSKRQQVFAAYDGLVVEF